MGMSVECLKKEVSYLPMETLDKYLLLLLAQETLDYKHRDNIKDIFVKYCLLSVKFPFFPRDLVSSFSLFINQIHPHVHNHILIVYQVTLIILFCGNF